MSPRTGFEATLLDPDFESPKLTMIVPPMQRSTLISFTQVKISPKNTRDTRNVNKLDELLKMVFDCKENQNHNRITHWLTEADITLHPLLMR